MSSRPPRPSSLAVVAILADRDASLDHTLEAVALQSYAPVETFVVGGDYESVAAALGVGWEESLQSLVGRLEPTITHVWLLAAGTAPHPDALYTLISESERVGAGLAGSKLLDLEHPDRLISVGLTTDVFGVPYLGIEEDELDAGQYDVLRDVAAAAPGSLVARRDLLKGLGGLDRLLAPQAAAIDLSQRARVLGARVVVVPSSKVAAPSGTESAWREEAGRIRAMLKVYSWLTLAWALPTRFLIGLVEAVLAPLAGRWTLFRWLRAWLWNLARLPSTLRARRAVRANAAAGDAELFRYQMRGSVTLRSLWADLVETARARFPSDDRGIGALAQEMRRPAFGVALAALVFSFVATRELWQGFPGGGLSMPLPDSGADAVAAYAGGWNPAGFGSTEQLPPFLGLAGVWQQVLFDRADLASGSLALLAFLGGIWGITRLLRTWSVDSVPGILAGVAYMAGPAARTIAGSGDVANVVALAAVPWAMRVAVAPWPAGWIRRIGRIAAAGWLSALLANLSPDLLLLPLAALLAKALLAVREGINWLSVLVAASGVAIAVPLLRPWVTSVDFTGYFRAGVAYWEPGTVLLTAGLLATAAAIIAAPDGLWRLAAWGGIVAAIGGVLARTAGEGGGRHLLALGLAAVALGTSVVVGSAFEAVRRAAGVDSLRRLVLGIGAVGAAAVVVSALAVLAPGRGGMPADELGAALRFTGASIDDNSAARVLLVGPPESLPGNARRVRGAAYRVISVPSPRMWEVELPSPGPADAALEQVLEAVIEGESFRAGEQLAEFGIRWILAMGETPLSAAFVGQLDLIPLDGLRRPAFLVDSEEALRAMTVNGDPWRVDGTGFAGPAAPAVLIREQADAGWGLDADPGDWSMTLDGSSGSIEYQAGPERRQGQLALWLGAGLALLSAILRRRR